MNGYASSQYVKSLAEFGRPLALPECEGWLLARSTAIAAVEDAAGPYPITCCGRWSALPDALAALPAGIASVSLIPDPLSDVSMGILGRAFPDVCRPFKEHFVVDLESGWRDRVSSHHRRRVRQTVQVLTIERCESPVECLEQWSGLYGELVARHGIRGIARFSHTSFALQLATPGMLAFRALHNGQLVGMTLWFVQNERAYYHLMACNADGYACGAAYALFDAALESCCAAGCDRAGLGGGAGWKPMDDGLVRFKRGWSTQTTQAWFCGRIVDRAAYGRLCMRQDVGSSEFFPKYRFAEAA